MIPYKEPELSPKAFNCPQCGAYSNQRWEVILHYIPGITSPQNLSELRMATCVHCDNYTLWHFEKMTYPEDSGVRPPNQDLDEGIKADYLEAKSIANKSPRGAAALLRLCIQKLCVQLGESGNKLDSDIANLVKKGLPIQVQQALDIVRVIGNNAIHPGQIDLTDDRATATKLFELINLIADVMITQPKHVQSLYETLPATARQAIEKRDSDRKA